MKSGNWIISRQVIQEFCHVALHLITVPIKSEDLTEYLDIVLWPRCSMLPSLPIYQSAARWHKSTQYRFYDCLMVASAISGGASVLYSEDLQPGRHLDALEIESPLKPKRATEPTKEDLLV